MGGVLGDITRGTTHPNRLRRIDRWILHRPCGTIRAAADPLVVDLGYGASPVTTVEMHNRLAAHVRADVDVVGIEIDPQRVRDAQPLAQEHVSFIHGGFEVPVAGRRPILIRASNVLRQYDESEVPAAWHSMTSRLADDGYLVEGTCDEIGRLGSWVAIRAGQSEPETFTISVHVAALEKPSDIAARLPKALIHRNVEGERVHDFLQAFDDAWMRTSHTISFGPRAHWVAAVEHLAAAGFHVMDNVGRWRLGEVTVPWSVVAP
jgi:hypothetical protein